MKTTFVYTLIITTIIIISQTHAMNEFSSLKIFHKKTDFQSFPLYERQIKLPDDVIDKIIAPYSYRTRCQLRRTCKQLYYLNHMNRLDKFMLHDFIIGDKKEMAFFFKDVIQNNNPTHVSLILHIAQKDAEKHHPTKNKTAKTENNDTIIILNKPVCDNAQELFIQNSYFNPLLERAAKYKNNAMITALVQQGGDPEVVDRYYRGLCNFYKNITARVVTAVCVFGIILWIPIRIALDPSNSTNSTNYTI